MTTAAFRVTLALFGLFLTSPLFASSSAIIGAYFGNQAVVDSSMSPVTMSTNVQISASFTQPVDDQITGVWVHGTTLGACPSYNAYIVNDDGSGLPDMAGGVITGDSHSMSNGWTKIGFLGPASVLGGVSYHMVLNSGGAAGNGTNCFVLDQATMPLHQIIPFNQLLDGSLFTTNDNGGGFVETDNQPVFILEETNNYGNTYALNLGNNVYGGNAVGELLQGPVTNTWVSKVGAYLQRISSPAGPLVCQLNDLTAPQTFGPVTLATNATANTSFSWIEVNLPGAPIQLISTHLYRLWFSSPLSTSGAFYIINAPSNPTGGTPYDDQTYDGVNSYLNLSGNGGVTWANNVSADLAFRFLVSAPPTATPTQTATLTPTRTPTMTPTATVTATPPAPSIGGLNPTNGNTSGGYAVTLFGSNLSGPATVTWSGSPVTITNQTASQLVVTAPAGGGASVPIIALVNGQTSNTVNFAYDPPTLSSVLPGTGSVTGGYPVTLSGTNFFTTATVTFGGVSAPVTSVNAGTLVVIAPAGSGTVSVVVSVSGQVSNTGSFTYSPPTFTPTSTPTPTATSTPTSTLTPAILCGGLDRFGKSAIGVWGDDQWAGTVDAIPATLTRSGVVDSLSFYALAATDGEVKMALYTDGGGFPATLLAQTAPQTAVYGWNTLDLPNTAVTPGVYWIAFQVDPGHYTTLAHDSTTPLEHYYTSSTYSFALPFQDPFPAGSTSGGDNFYSMVANYCPLAGGTSTPTPTLSATPSYICPSSPVTFGQTAPGTITYDNLGDTTLTLDQYFLPQSGTLQGAAIYLQALVNGTIRMAVYTNNAGTPGTLVGESSPQQAVLGWNYLPIPPAAMAGPATYWVGYRAVGDMTFTYNTGGPGDAFEYTEFAPQPASFVPSGPNNPFRWSFFAVVCPNATATPTPSITPTPSSTPTRTPSFTPTITPTRTTTFTPTLTPTASFTPTLSPTPTATGQVTATPTPDQALYLDNNFFDPAQGPLGMDVRVDTAGAVKIAVFNIVGEEVTKLVDQTLTPGNYRFHWDGTNAKNNVVGNGVYFILIQQPSGHTVRKVAVLK